MGLLEIVLLILLGVTAFTGAKARSMTWLILPCVLVMAVAWMMAYFLEDPLIAYGAAIGCITGAVSAKIAQRKGRHIVAWFFVGLIFSLLGILLIAVMQPNTEAVEQEALSSGSMKRCPHCAELVRREAVKCRFCGEALEKVTD